MLSSLRRLTLLSIILLATACSSVPSEYRSLPPAKSWRASAAAAMKHPRTWVPAAAAVAVAVSGNDRSIGSHAAEQTPLFGTPKRAEEMSNSLKGALHVVMLASVLLPTTDEAPLAERAMMAAANELTTIPNDVVTGWLKGALDRERPDRSNRMSLPSGHSSAAAAYAAIADTNLKRARVSRRTRLTMQVVSELLVAGTAWARVEANKHHPTDVLAGAALGHFLTATIDRAVRDRGSVPFRLFVQPRANGIAFSVAIPVQGVSRLVEARTNAPQN